MLPGQGRVAPAVEQGIEQRAAKHLLEAKIAGPCRQQWPALLDQRGFSDAIRPHEGDDPASGERLEMAALQPVPDIGEPLPEPADALALGVKHPQRLQPLIGEPGHLGQRAALLQLSEQRQKLNLPLRFGGEAVVFQAPLNFRQ